ncbi:MAG: hypothetical protein IJF11_01360 [Clostridia bacterium]|nr:hypothetical protein [Clostridia bacterium]
MSEIFSIYDFDVVCDIDAEYDSEYDAQGFIKHIEENYKAEIADDDDMPLVYIGICVTLNKRNIPIPDELKVVVSKLLKSKGLVERIREDEEYFKSFKKWRTKFLKAIEKNESLETEFVKYVSPFTNWRENDVYMVDITESPDEERYVFIRVVEIREEKTKYYPQIYLFIMPDFSSNFGIDTLDEIVYLPVSVRFDCRGLYDYLYELVDDALRKSCEKEIKYVGNYQLKDPQNLIDLRKSSYRARFLLEEITNERLERINLKILKRMQTGDIVGGGESLFEALEREKAEREKKAE